jgi:glycosyltransferase involved in cell wall biosynthesis
LNEGVIIVIPAFNEEQTVAQVVKNCLRFGRVLVVDDGSSDGTRLAAESAGAFVVSNAANKGYEHSLRVGYEFAQKENFDVMISMDADGQLPAELIPNFLTEMAGGAFLVVGKRKYLPRFTEKCLAYSASCLSDLSDPYCGMKAYRLKVVSCHRFSRYNSVGTSLALDYIELGLKTVNVEINVVRRVGQSRFGGTLTSELRLFPSMLIAQYRLAKIWLKKFFR